MTKRKYKEERKKILEKYGRPMSEIPDKYLKDRNGCWFWLKDLIDYKRQEWNKIFQRKKKSPLMRMIWM